MSQEIISCQISEWYTSRITVADPDYFLLSADFLLSVSGDALPRHCPRQVAVVPFYHSVALAPMRPLHWGPEPIPRLVVDGSLFMSSVRVYKVSVYTSVAEPPCFGGSGSNVFRGSPAPAKIGGSGRGTNFCDKIWLKNGSLKLKLMMLHESGSSSSYNFHQNQKSGFRLRLRRKGQSRAAPALAPAPKHCKKYIFFKLPKYSL